MPSNSVFRARMGLSSSVSAIPRSQSFCTSSMGDPQSAYVYSAGQTGRFYYTRRRIASQCLGLPPITEHPKEEKAAKLEFAELSKNAENKRKASVEAAEDRMAQVNASSQTSEEEVQPSNTTTRSDTLTSEAGSVTELQERLSAQAGSQVHRNPMTNKRPEYLDHAHHGRKREIALSIDSLEDPYREYSGSNDEKLAPIVEYEVPEPRSSLIKNYVITHKYKLLISAVCLCIFIFIMYFIVSELVKTLAKKH